MNVLITLNFISYSFHLKSSAVACRYWFFLECQSVSWQLALESSFWGKQVKNLPIFTVDCRFGWTQKTVFILAVPEYWNDQNRGRKEGFRIGFLFYLSSLHSGSVWKGVPGVRTCISGVQPPSGQQGNRFQILGGHTSYIFLRFTASSFLPGASLLL